MDVSNSDAGSDLMLKEQGVVFKIYEYFARGTYVNLVYVVLIPYLLPSFFLYAYLSLPFFGFLVVLSSMLGMAISTFCGLRGSRANASAELQKDIDKASIEVQRAALEACYFHTNKRVPSGSENVLAKYTEEASSMILTG